MFVVDASVTLAWCFEDESSEFADTILARLATETALAPAHWPLEVANGIRSAERRGRVDADDAVRLRTLLVALPVEIAPVELSTAMGTIDRARDLDLSVYAASYLDLAQIRDLPLATIDARLRAACEEAGVELLA